MYMCVYVIYISEWVVDDLRNKTPTKKNKENFGR